mmetsp:Transcript_13019/g.27823  ORF Transcript_13019/g.27823 Transcript_13019/m.27823 type:complete len:226 (+) Transcript_13019:611-1288(+)
MMRADGIGSAPDGTSSIRLMVSFDASMPLVGPTVPTLPFTTHEPCCPPGQVCPLCSGQPLPHTMHLPSWSWLRVQLRPQPLAASPPAMMQRRCPLARSCQARSTASSCVPHRRTVKPSSSSLPHARSTTASSPKRDTSPADVLVKTSEAHRMVELSKESSRGDSSSWISFCSRTICSWKSAKRFPPRCEAASTCSSRRYSSCTRSCRCWADCFAISSSTFSASSS